METQSIGVDAPYLTSDKDTFAYVAVKDLWPKVVTGTIDDVHRTSIASTDDLKASEGKRIVAALATFKYELQHDRRLTPLPDDGQPDIKDYNARLEELGRVKWFNAPYLFAECYLYRRIHTHFSLSTHWKNYDVFARKKTLLLRSFRGAIIDLAATYRTLITSLSDRAGAEDINAAEKSSFTEICSFNFEANTNNLAHFLSSLSGPSDSSTLFSNKATVKTKRTLQSAYRILKKAQLSDKQDRNISIVLSTAGLPLFTSLLLASYLLTTNLATHITLHPRSIPWFVTSATPTDFAALLSALADPASSILLLSTTPSEEDLYLFGTEEQQQGIQEKEQKEERDPASAATDLSYLFTQLSAFHADGKLSLRPHAFWTSFHSYRDLALHAPALWTDLEEAEMVILGGELHWRRLTGDVKTSAAGGFEGMGKGVRVLFLGGRREDEDEEQAGDSSGVLFYDGKA